jgi:AbrB family looped-hinge helix DNA binding protein
MKTTIDHAGRLVIPKDIRRESGIKPGMPLEVRWEKGAIAITPAKLVDAEISAHLQIPAGSPVLFVERNYFCKKELVLRTMGFYRSDLFRYELKLKRGTVKPS